MFKKLSLIMLLVIPFWGMAQQKNGIIPHPVSLVYQEGNFKLNAITSISYNKADKEMEALVNFFKSSVENVTGHKLLINKKVAQQIKFALVNDEKLGTEGYRLKVTSSGVEIIANKHGGLFYGMQTLLQTLPLVRTNQLAVIPCMEVEDYPRFKWRGMMLDVSRHFFSADVIKQFIDLMATYKMNVFHWHLCDDSGWRIEIKKYPKLTDVGAWRVDRLDRVWSDREPAKAGEAATYGGYYTQEQVKDIVAYAKLRNITIVPEIEMPGHSVAALAAYPEFSCTQKPQFVNTGGVYPKGIQANYCAGNDSVFLFLQDVLTEVMALFPSEYIHVGGDEVDKSGWKNCDRCQNRMKREGLKDENELQSYFIRRMEKFLSAHNRKLIGWDEILEGGLAPAATVMSWRGEAGGIEAAKMHHNVVMTPGSPCYFDHYQSGPEGEPVAIGGMNTLKKVYSYEPIPKELTAEEGKFVLGAQANLWTEYVPTVNQLEYMILPRMLALAEVVWSPVQTRNWLDFNQRLKTHYRAFDKKGINHSKGNYKVDIKPVSHEGKLTVSLETELIGGDIYYTLDGTNPGLNALKYTGPFEINTTSILKAVTVVNGQVMGPVAAEQIFSFHKAIGREVNYTYPVSRYYMADGPNSLTDGVRGTQAVGKYWHGFAGSDMVATIDLGENKPLKNMALGCLQKYNDWIFLPQGVKFEVSTDGMNFKEVQTVMNPVDVNEKNATIHQFKADFPVQQARFVRVTAKNLGVCPKGHSGEGQAAWLFVDEIVVE
jgi:hexosaminidase